MRQLGLVAATRSFLIGQETQTQSPIVSVIRMLTNFNRARNIQSLDLRTWKRDHDIGRETVGCQWCAIVKILRHTPTAERIWAVRERKREEERRAAAGSLAILQWSMSHDPLRRDTFGPDHTARAPLCRHDSLGRGGGVVSLGLCRPRPSSPNMGKCRFDIGSRRRNNFRIRPDPRVTSPRSRCTL